MERARIHLVFLTVIILHSVLGNMEETIYTAMNNAFFDKQYDKTWQTASGANAQSQLTSNFGAFTSQSVIDVADTRTTLEPRDLFKFRDMADICGWVQGNLARGIFHTGVNQNDATGALMTYNRIIGGVRFEVTTQPWVTDQQAYSLHWPYFFWWFGGRPPTSTTVSCACGRRRTGRRDSSLGSNSSSRTTSRPSPATGVLRRGTGLAARSTTGRR